MSLSSARNKFEEVAKTSMEHDIKRLAEGLVQLAQGISGSITKLENDLAAIKNRVNSIR